MTSGAAVEIEAAAEPIGNDAMDDMQAETSAALMAAGGEERVECLPPHGPHDFAVRCGRFVRRAKPTRRRSVHRIPSPTFRDDREASLMRAEVLTIKKKDSDF